MLSKIIIKIYIYIYICRLQIKLSNIGRKHSRLNISFGVILSLVFNVSSSKYFFEIFICFLDSLNYALHTCSAEHG